MHEHDITSKKRHKSFCAILFTWNYESEHFKYTNV